MFACRQSAGNFVNFNEDRLTHKERINMIDYEQCEELNENEQKLRRSQFKPFLIGYLLILCALVAILLSNWSR